MIELGFRFALARALSAAMMLAALQSGAAAQASEYLAPSSRLRVTYAAPDVQVQIGTLRNLNAAELVLMDDGSTRTIPLATIRRLEVSRGKQPNVVGGLVGLAVGSLAGGVVGCAANRDDYDVFCGGQSDAKVFIGAAVGGIAGAAAGALLFRRERWNQIELDSIRTRRP